MWAWDIDPKSGRYYPYAHDVWAWDIDPKSGRYYEWHDGEKSIVKHHLDAMVIFDSSHVVPLFVATRPGLTRWPGCYDDDDYDWYRFDDPDEVDLPVNLWYGPHGPVVDWQRLKIPMDVNDRLGNRGWVARHGHRNLLSGGKTLNRLANCAEVTSAKRFKRKGCHAYVNTQQKQDSINSLSRIQHSKKLLRFKQEPVQDVRFFARKLVVSKKGRARHELRTDLVDELHEARVAMLQE